VCPGLVEANQLAPDFPAKSFFEVYVQVTLPPVGTFPGSVLYNNQPLVVQNLNLNSFPPAVAYTHEQSTAVPLKFKSTNPGKWNKDDVFGYMVLAGHATQASCDSNSTAQVTAFLDQVLGTAANPVTEKPIPAGVPLNGTTASECCGGKPTFSQVPQPNVYSGFNGQIAAVTCFPANPAGGYPAPFDPTAYALGVIDLQNPAPPVGVNYAPPMFHGPAGNQWTGAKLGSIFGVCFDNIGNIYVTPTTCYYSDVPGTSGNFGSVYKIDYQTGLISVFATLPNPVIGGVAS